MSAPPRVRRIPRWPARLLLPLLLLRMSAQPPSPPPDVAPAAINLSGGFAAHDGIPLEFDLGETRQNWTHARWRVLTFAEPQDFRNAAGFLLDVETDTPRRDAGVYLAIREADGTWYSHPWAAGLAAAGGRNRGEARFEHFSPPLYHAPPAGNFQDANGSLDLDRITAIAIGVVNPLGVGRVSFTLRDLSLLPASQAPEEVPARLEVSGRLLDINGTDTLPAGLFGGFHLGTGRHARFRLAADRTIHHDGVSGSPRLGGEFTPLHVNTIGDRVRPSPRLTRADWEERSAALGRAMGLAARESGNPLYAEYWNEPYLNWANFNRANFIPRFYDESRAAEGGPVHILHDGAEVPHLIWTRDRRHLRPFMLPGRLNPALDHWRRGRTADGRALSASAPPYRGMESYYAATWEPESHPPLDTADGETYEYQGQTLTAFTPWHIVDTSQFTYWSGQGMLPHYIDPMLAFGRALKEAHPEAVFIVGWGNRPGEDHWAGFHQLYRPAIDAGIDIIDGYNDHDYGGDPTNMGAQYEVMTAYGMTRHNKWLFAYNTETGANTDPQVYRDQATVSANIGKFDWVTRKMMHAMAEVPDKARMFLHFGDGDSTGSSGSGWWSDKGEGIAMEMLINLRGRLLHTRGMEEDLHIVATVDGTDPLAPRPDFLGPQKELVVAVYNARQTPRRVDLLLNAPAGAELGPGRVRRSSRVDGQLVVLDEPRIPVGNRLEENAELTPRELRVYSFPILNHAELAPNPQQWPGAENPVLRRQFFGQTLLTHIHAEAPVQEQLSLSEEALRAAASAQFTFVARNLHGHSAVLVLNRTRISLPAALPPENNDARRTVSLPMEALRAENQISIEVADPGSPGFFLGMWSLWLETDPPTLLE